MAKRGGKRAGSGRKHLHPEGRTTKLVANVPEVLVIALEHFAVEKGLTRSEAVTEAVRAQVKQWSSS